MSQHGTGDLPPAILDLAQRYALETKASLSAIDAAYFDAFARAVTNPAKIAIIHEHALHRFDCCAKSALPWAKTNTPTVNPLFAEMLEQVQERTLTLAEQAFASLTVREQEDELTKLAVRLRSRELWWIAEAARQQLARLPPLNRAAIQAEVDAFNAQCKAANAPPAQFAFTTALKRKRMTLIRSYRREHDMTMDRFARYVGSTPSGIYGAINEDWSRLALDTRNRILEKLGVTVEEWYSESE